MLDVLVTLTALSKSKYDALEGARKECVKFDRRDVNGWWIVDDGGLRGNQGPTAIRPDDGGLFQRKHPSTDVGEQLRGRLHSPPGAGNGNSSDIKPALFQRVLSSQRGGGIREVEDPSGAGPPDDRGGRKAEERRSSLCSSQSRSELSGNAGCCGEVPVR